MFAMPERSWEWLLPTGERLAARYDPDTGTESVYLGPRLVSRAHGGKPGGHTVEIMHGDAAGPFRGGSTARVVFGFEPMGPRCDVTVDDRPLEPTEVPPVAQPKDVPPDAVVVGTPLRANRRFFAAFAALGIGLVAAAYLSAREEWRRTHVGPPLQIAARTPNGMLRVRYSDDFHVAVEALPQDKAEIDATPPDARQPPLDAPHHTNVVSLTRSDRGGGIFFIALPHAGAADADALERRLATGMSEPWAKDVTAITTRWVGLQRCAGEEGNVVVRTAWIDSSAYTVWSCTLVKSGRGYRFVTVWLEQAPSTEYTLRQIVEATTLLEK
jgi:hypothetical protein